MAVKFIAQTDTLEKFRTEFNDLSANQFGDIANLSGAISANNIVDAMNETISIATSTAGFTIRDNHLHRLLVVVILYLSFRYSRQIQLYLTRYINFIFSMM